MIQKTQNFNAVCENVADGLSLRTAISKLNGKYSRATFYRELAKDVELQRIYEIAMQLRADIIFDDILSIADNEHISTEITETAEGVYKENIRQCTSQKA